MDRQATILFVDDESNILSALKRLMRKTPYHCLFANGGKDALALLDDNIVDVVISDMKMPEMTGEELLSEVSRLYPETMRIVLSGFSEESMIMGAINEGRIWGFIHKPWNDAELKQVIDHAVFTQHVIAERTLLRLTVEKYKAIKKGQFADFLGESVAMQLIYTAIEKAAPSNASVFITGGSKISSYPFTASAVSLNQYLLSKEESPAKKTMQRLRERKKVNTRDKKGT